MELNFWRGLLRKRPHDKANKGDTPLHEAAREGYTETVAALLKAGADHKAQNEFGATPLHRAARKSCTETVAALLADGADANAKDSLLFPALAG